MSKNVEAKTIVIEKKEIAKTPEITTYNKVESGKRIVAGEIENYTHILPLVVNGKEIDLTSSQLQNGKPAKITISPKFKEFHFVVNFESKGNVSLDIYKDDKIWISHLTFQSMQLYLLTKLNLTKSGTNYNPFHNVYLEGTGRKEAKTILVRKEG